MSKMLKEFKGKEVDFGNYEIEILPESHFLEMGSAYGMYFPGAVSFFRKRTNDSVKELSREVLSNLVNSIKKFCKKNNLDIDEEYPFYNTTDIKFNIIRKDEFEQLCCVIWADYGNIWVRIFEVDHQTEYIDLQKNLCILPANVFIEALKIFNTLIREYGYPDNGYLYSNDEMRDFEEKEDDLKI